LASQTNSRIHEFFAPKIELYSFPAEKIESAADISVKVHLKRVGRDMVEESLKER
jgi:hypothetical protein